jgi:hypothetical protein
VPAGDALPNEVLAPDVVASLIYMGGGNFRLLTRLLAQIEPILKANQLDTVSKEIVAAARDSLVIGQVWTYQYPLTPSSAQISTPNCAPS